MVLFIFIHFKITFCLQDVDNLIRLRVLRCPIWFCSVCQCPEKMTLCLYGQITAVCVIGLSQSNIVIFKCIWIYLRNVKILGEYSVGIVYLRPPPRWPGLISVLRRCFCCCSFIDYVGASTLVRGYCVGFLFCGLFICVLSRLEIIL